MNPSEKPEYLSRNELQEYAMTAIYDTFLYRKLGIPADVEDIVSSLLETDYADCDYFVKAAVILSLKHEEEIIAKYQEHMNHWLFSRRNRLEQAILMLSYVHYFYIDPNVDKAIVINIGVKLSKKYCSPNDFKFVNAILDKVLNR